MRVNNCAVKRESVFLLKNDFRTNWDNSFCILSDAYT